MKCVICGEKAYKDNLCKDCYNEQNPLLENYKKVKLKICSQCNTYFNKGKWVKYKDLNLLIEKLVRKNLIIKGKIKKIVIQETDVKLTLCLDDVCEDYQLDIEINKDQCLACSKKGSQYFEGILQLRNCDDEILDYVYNDSKKRDKFITKVVKQKTGFDLYISSKQYLVSLGNKLYKEFGGEHKVNSQLFSHNRQTSKDIYRVNVLLKLPDFKKGSVVVINNNVVWVKNSGKKISGINLATGKKVSFDSSKVEPELLKIKDTSVCKIRPSIEVLDPETYENVPVQNKVEVKNGQEVKVVEHKGLYYII